MHVHELHTSPEDVRRQLNADSNLGSSAPTGQALERWRETRRTVSGDSCLLGEKWKLAKWELGKWELAKWELAKWQLAKWKLAKSELAKWKLAKWELAKRKLAKWELAKWELAK